MSKLCQTQVFPRKVIVTRKNVNDISEPLKDLKSLMSIK